MYRAAQMTRPTLKCFHGTKLLKTSSTYCASRSKYLSAFRISAAALTQSGTSPPQPRNMASMAAPLPRKVSKVTEHLIYHQYHPEETEAGKTPIVLFLPWITVNERSARRFEDVYGRRGFNVLTVWNEVKYFIWPKSSFHLSKEVLKYLQAEVDCDLVVHGMSIGAYLYTMMVMQALKDPEQTSYLREHVKGNVFDSIVCGGLNQMAIGLSKSVASNALLGTLVRQTFLIYFSLTKSHTVDVYDEAIQLYFDNPLLTSVLLLYSTADHMSDSDMVDSLVQTWRDRGLHVRLQRWTDSKHVELMKDHTEEYLARLDEYLAYIKPRIAAQIQLSAKL